MNFFETTLRKIFDNVEGIDNVKYIGRNCFADLGGGKVMKAYFTQVGMTGGKKNALEINIIGKNDGSIDSTTIRFADVWSHRFYICGNSEPPQIWVRNGKDEWFTPQPTTENYLELSNMVSDYVGFYSELNIEQNEGMSGMGM